MATKKYTVMSPVLADQKYEVGETIELDTKQAKELLELGVLAEQTKDKAA